MLKTKDGYAKLVGTSYNGNANYLLKSDGGVWQAGNANGNIPISNGATNTNLNADLLDGIHATGFVKTTNSCRISQYNSGTWHRFLTFTISSGTLLPSISFIWHPTECQRGIYSIFNINIRSNDIIFMETRLGTDSRTLKCTGDGTTFYVWVKGTKGSYDPYGCIQHLHSFALQSYLYYSLTGATDSEPSGTYNKIASLTGLVSYSSNSDMLDGQHGSYYATAASLGNYLPLAGDWMNTDARIYFKGANNSTSAFTMMGYDDYGPMYCPGNVTLTKAFYIMSNGYANSNDWGGIAIDNEGVTVFGAGDGPASGKTLPFTGVFRVLNEDNVADGPQFLVTKASGATIKRNLTVGFKETASYPSSETSALRLTLVPTYHTGGPWNIHSKDDSGSAYLTLSYGASERIRVRHDGHIGLGTTSTTEMLTVNGNISLYNNGSIKNLAIGGGIYWNPYVESSSDGSDAASITVLKSGAAGGTELRILQLNDYNDIINLCSPYYIYLNSKKAFSIYDYWLRINEDSAFSSGIYTGSSLIRSDNQLQVGSGGNDFYANNSGNGYFRSTLGIAGTNLNYKLYVNGNSNVNHTCFLHTYIPEGARTVGWYRIAKLTSGNDGYFNFILLHNAWWNWGSSNLCTFIVQSCYEYASITLLSGEGRYGGTISSIRLVHISGGSYYLDVYNLYYSSGDGYAQSSLHFNFIGDVTAELYTPETPLSTSETAHFELGISSIYGTNITSSNYTNYVYTKGEVDTMASRYLPLAGGQMTGAAPITFLRNTIALNFSNHSDLKSQVEFMTSGQEALVFANQYAHTSFMFFTGLNLTNRSDWHNLGDPDIQIKRKCLYINKLIGNGVSPTYNLYVNGTFYAGNTTPADGYNTVPYAIASTLETSGWIFSVGNANKGLLFGVRGNNNIIGNSGAGTDIILQPDGGNVGIGIAPAYKLDVNGDIWARGAMRIGSSSQNNYLAFYGVYGDYPGGWDHTFIGERIYASGTELSELLIAHGNDIGDGYGAYGSGSGCDRIRLFGGGIRFDIGNIGYSGWEGAANSSATTILDLALYRATLYKRLYISLPSDLRHNGIVGTYDPYRLAAMWSMGDSYQISSDGLGFGNLYGFAYTHHDYVTGSGQIMGYGHLAVWAVAGTPMVGIGEHVWARNCVKIGTHSTNDAKLSILENTFAIDFRPGSADGYTTGFTYGTYGQEYLALLTINSGTSLIFANGYNPRIAIGGSFISNNGGYNYGTSSDVGMQIKQNCVNIGDVWRHGVSPDYKLKITGKTGMYYSASDGNPVFKINLTANNYWAYAMEIRNPNMSNDTRFAAFFAGKYYSNYNSLGIYYHHVADSSSSNHMGVHVHGWGDVLDWYPGAIYHHVTLYGYGIVHRNVWSSAYVFTTDGGYAHIGSMSVNYANYAGYLSNLTRETRYAWNSSNEKVGDYTGFVTDSLSFIEVRGFCPPNVYRTSHDRPAPFGIGFGNGSESGGIMPIGQGDCLLEIAFYGANSGPTTFTFKRQLWESSSYQSVCSNYYSSSVLSINTSSGNSTFYGKVYIDLPSSARNRGIIGSYDYTRAAAIWAMGESYLIASDGSTFGSLYGAAYKYGAYINGVENAGGHQFVWCDNGDVRASLGYYGVWARDNVVAESNSARIIARASSDSNYHLTLEANYSWTWPWAITGYGSVIMRGHNGTSHLSIAPSGQYVGIGIDAPVSKLLIEGTTYSNLGGSSKPSFRWNKSGTYWGGIGYNGTTNVNEFGPATNSDTWANVDTSDTWRFRGILQSTRQLNSNDYRFNNYLAYYNTNTSTITGIFEITLPNGWNSTMMAIEIDVYEYDSTHSHSKIIIGGYNYSGKYWTNYRTSVLGNYDKAIRLAYNNSSGKCCILLGATNSSWSYPLIWITSVKTGYNALTSWISGYSITGSITSEANYTAIVTPSRTDVLYSTYSYYTQVDWSDSNSTWYLAISPGSGQLRLRISAIYANPAYDSIGINTTTNMSSYKLNVGGDSWVSGWSRAGGGFYCENTGVHFTHLGSIGEIDVLSNNEFLWGSSASTLYFNYRGVSRGTTVTNYVWNAGSSSSWAQHTLGKLFLHLGDATLKFYSGVTTDGYNDGAIAMQTCIDGHDGETNYYASSLPAREAIYLQPRGGYVRVGYNLLSASTAVNGAYRPGLLAVNGNIQFGTNIYHTSTGAQRFQFLGADGSAARTSHRSIWIGTSYTNSDGDHYIYGNAGRIFFGGNFHIDSLGSNSTYINYYTTNTIRLANGDRLDIDSTGRVYPNSTAKRRSGMYGVYDSYKIGHIWSMGTSYMIPDDGSSFGNLYGLAYTYHNRVYTSTTMGGGHLAVWCVNGTPLSAMGDYVWSRNGFLKEGSSNSYVLLGGGGHKALSDFSMNGHTHDGRYLRYSGWWSSGSGQSLDNANGMIFAYSNHGHPGSWGIVTTFDYSIDSSYRLLLAGDGYNNELWFRNRSADRGGWYTGWAKIRHSRDTYVASDGTYRGFIGGSEIQSTRYLLINGVTWTGSFHWSGLSGLPSWLWGSNNGSTMYIWNPSNFHVWAADLLYPINSNPNNSHTPGYGLRVWYSWNQGQANNASSGYCNGLTIGSHPSDTGYGWQICQNMWNDRTYTRRYNGGWQTWLALRDSGDTYVSTYGVIGGLEIPCIRHLLINGVTWWSNWTWSGQSGQPNWLWGSNDGTNMYVWNPSNFTVNRARAIYYSGTGTNEVTAYLTSDSYFGRSGWATYIIGNHGDGSSYYHQIIAMPFWGMPQYQRMEGGSNTSWYTFAMMGYANSGSLYADSFYENSDIRYKRIIKYLNIETKQISELPIFDFEWTLEQSNLRTGTSAQEVLKILPYLVNDIDNRLTLDYGALGTISGIAACREIEKLKEKILYLESKLKELEKIDLGL